MVLSGGSDMRQYPKPALIAKSAMAMAAGTGSRVRSVAAMPAATAPIRNVTPRKPTSAAVCISIGAPTCDAAGVLTDPPPLSNEAKKSNMVHSAANANIAGTAPKRRSTRAAPTTETANETDGAQMIRNSTGAGMVPP